MHALRLRYLSGPRRGDEVVFSGPRVRIGRSRDNSLVLSESDAPSSSARHAEAAFEDGGWWIVDSGSTNGTFVNGARVVRRRLAIGDQLSFGNDQFIVAGGGMRVWLTAAAVVGLLAVVAGATYATRRKATLSPEQIASAAAQSVYAVALESGGVRTIIGTAFAVDGSYLATNAHVANVLREQALPGPGAAARPAAIAIRSDTNEVGRITAVRTHADWRPGSIRADAALLRVDSASLGPPVTLASGGDFDRLRRGMSVVTFGFPAVSTDARHPRGRLSVDIVGDVRGEYLQAGLAIAPGASGSPVFDDEGAVVAMVAAGDFVKGTNGALMPTGSQANWAISVERVRELLRH